MNAINDAVIQGIQNFVNNRYLATILLSVVPMIEVRGAITVGTSLGMNPWIAFVLSCCSALIVCPMLLFLLKPILKLLKKVKWFNRLAFVVEDFFKGKANKLDDESTEKVDISLTQKQRTKRSIINKTIGIFLFVAIPIPMTGVWTGSAVATFLDLQYRFSIPAIVVGNFVAGLIITLLNIILAEYATIILLVLGLFMIISIAYIIAAIVVKSKKMKKQQEAEKPL